jgi:MFS family permease
VANVAGVLIKPDTLGLTPEQVGLSSSVYLVGQVLGALFFGRLTDTYGRKKLFLVTLAVYLAGTALSGAAIDFYTFAVCRFIAGAGIGGEVSAINSAIDELIPARLRGTVDLGINGSYWIGVMFGALLTNFLLNESVIPHAAGWRLVFGLGAILGVSIALVRKFVPESPPLVAHARPSGRGRPNRRRDRNGGAREGARGSAERTSGAHQHPRHRFCRHGLCGAHAL